MPLPNPGLVPLAHQHVPHVVVLHGGVDGGQQGGAALVSGQGEGERKAWEQYFICAQICLNLKNRSNIWFVITGIRQYEPIEGKLASYTLQG